MMELGQIKLDYNNEALKIRKHFIQAKTQCINNLSRKGKQLKSRPTSDKCPDEIKEKNKRKLDTIVAEILLMKKLKHDEVARFAMINFDKLTKVMDSPIASKEKAMAKIASHKVLKPKLLQIKEKFSHVPTEKLLEIDPKKQKLKKKKKEKSKLKKAEMEKSSANITEISKSKKLSTTEDIEEDGDEILNKFYNTKSKSTVKSTDSSDGEESTATDSVEEDDTDDDDVSAKSFRKTCDENNKEDSTQMEGDNEDNIGVIHDHQSDPSNSDVDSIERPGHIEDVKRSKNNDSKMNDINPPKNIEKSSKNKHKEKRMFVDMDDDNVNISSQKIVDSFFMTESGNNYFTVAIPRPPDAINNDAGDREYNEFSNTNRRLRRAAMFGTSVAPRMKKSFGPKQYKTTTDFKGTKNFKESNNQDGYSSKFRNKTDYHTPSNNRSNSNDTIATSISKVPEKLHPSWEAKKQKMSILPFQGKKVTFD